ncbi:DM13 domain-containing protein [Rubrivivax albus]|uniref:DM13 domain-containing protein n=1 Tax=Rubrivivax albus TaxID=2499835 RepID=A0A437JX18_9BURK|nr:DM13 domain-containing protein [Rubrivivax albus]RVT52224.1 hypothetical protein ENE75_07135 [Rubrivivax albus]
MRRRAWLGLAASHAVVGAAGFAGGIYVLPILTAPPPPPAAELAALQQAATFRGAFRRDLPGSDRLHWGEGDVAVGPSSVAHTGRLAPGPDYQLYLSPGFVDTEAAFHALKPRMRHVGPVKGFEGFVLPLPADVDLAAFDTVVVWCESFGEFITAAKYR